jgi:ribonucleoside-diphosphate reductase alpha chain
MYSDLIFKRTYARTQGESWGDAVGRYETYFAPRVPEKLKDDFKRAIELFKEKELVGSMRALATAGGALEEYPEALYNCSYLTFDSYRDFADMLMLLMLGVGVGYSIEPHTISLPNKPKKLRKADITITIGDSKEGWSYGFLALLETLQDGLIPTIDYSQIRPAGTPLKTFGGTASGPEPLRFLFSQTIRTFEFGKGNPWSPEEVFDLANSIAYAVISGGVRRSACIALANSKDAFKLKPKDFWSVKPWRSYSNISITDLEDTKGYIEYLKENQTGEPGIFNRARAQQKLIEVGREPEGDKLGGNPCLEIILRPFQFCNLTEVNVKPGDTLDRLKEKVRSATLLGALQSKNIPETLLNPKWRLNAIKEPLLGVSLTGLRTHEILGEASEEAQSWLKELRDEAHRYAEKVGRAMNLKFTAVTTVKPSGTTSQILATTSGLHSSYSKYFLRRLRIHKHDPLVEELRKYPVHFEVDAGNSETLVMEFPMATPNHRDRNLRDQLEYYKMFSEYWVDHNPSCTITVKDNEWGQLEEWIETNLDTIIGITFLPETNNYPQAPYQKLTQEEYLNRLQEWESIFSKPKVELFANLESLTSKSNEVTFACTSGTCEIDTL